MTVSYNLDISSVSTLSFLKLLWRWKGSIWKSVYTELFLWIMIYYGVMFVYRSDYFMDKEAKIKFEQFAAHCDKKMDYIPLTFMLGFFVTIIVDRWKNIFTNMGWIENQALSVAALARGDDETTRLSRRAIIRYLCLSQVLVFRDISMRVRRRFPNMDTIVKAGFMTEGELLQLEQVKLSYNKYWVPVQWACQITYNLHKAGSIEAPPSLNTVINDIKTFRSNLATLCNYDWVPIPIAYPQVVFCAVRVYFLICTVGRQFILGDNAVNKSVIDAYVPFMTILQFIFYMGWMKVAEALLNPLGEDDDDFECNFLIDKNISTGLAIVDDTWGKTPPLIKDSFSADHMPLYSEDSQKHGLDNPFMGSVAGVILASKTEDVKMVEVAPVEEEEPAARAQTTMRLRRRIKDSVLNNVSRGRSMSLHPRPLGPTPEINDEDDAKPDRPSSFNFTNGSYRHDEGDRSPYLETVREDSNSSRDSIDQSGPTPYDEKTPTRPRPLQRTQSEKASRSSRDHMV